MRAPLLALASLLAAAHALAAAPHDLHAAPYDCAPRDQRPPWRRLSDRIIRTVWRLPEHQTPAHAAAPQPAKGGRTSPSGALLARYGEDMVLRFNISSPYEAQKLAEAANVLFLDVWEFNGNWVDIRLAKNVVPSLLGLLPASLQHAHAPLMRDFELAQAIIDSYPFTDAGFPPAREPFSHALHSSQAETNIFFRDYQPLSVITPWMRLLESLFTTHVRMISIGTTYEGRDIPALRVGVHPKDSSNPSGPRKTILITGGTHAREWISTSTVNYIAYSLITQYGKTGITTALLESFDWVFVPTLNPDGYVYSWETDRLWRKNRQMTSVRFCRGVDLDRSYPFHWDGDATRGNPCSESYSGDAPFQGVEAKRFAEWAKNETEHNNVEFVGFLDLHSYSQQVLYPYSYSCYDDPPTLENLEELALGLAKAIRVSHGGHEYQATSACEGNVAYAAKKGKAAEKGVLPRIESGGGSALDWFYHELMIKNSYQIKLRDLGSYGFLLPKENIVPTGKEVLDAVYYLGKYMLGNLGVQMEDGETSAAETPLAAEEPSLDEPFRSKPLVSYDETMDEEYADEHIEWELRRRRRR